MVTRDLEGAEVAALAGGAGTHGRDRPIRRLEGHRDAFGRSDAAPCELRAALAYGLGYSAWSIGVGRGRSAADADRMAQDNVLFTPGPLPAILSHACPLRPALRRAGAVGDPAAAGDPS